MPRETSGERAVRRSSLCRIRPSSAARQRAIGAPRADTWATDRGWKAYPPAIHPHVAATSLRPFATPQRRIARRHTRFPTIFTTGPARTYRRSASLLVTLAKNLPKSSGRVFPMVSRTTPPSSRFSHPQQAQSSGSPPRPALAVPKWMSRGHSKSQNGLDRRCGEEAIPNKRTAFLQRLRHE